MGCRVSTTVKRLGNGFPRLSKVFRPMTTTLPLVIFLNHLKSSGRCHGILFSVPITRFSDIAAMALKYFMAGLLPESAGAPLPPASPAGGGELPDIVPRPRLFFPRARVPVQN